MAASTDLPASPAAPHETELKLAVPPSALPALKRRLARLGPARVQRLHTVYYDTPGDLLARSGMALRLRRAGRRWLQTLKSGDARAAFARRGEWEMAAPGGRLSLPALAATPLPALLAAHGDPPLAPRFSTRFDRTLRVARVGGARIEVALDQGEVSTYGGAQREPLLELELELKSGPPQALFELAQRLVGGTRSAALPLLPFTESKAARGHRLATGTAVAPLKANARAFAGGLPATDSAERALRHVIARGTDLWLANAHGLLAGDDPEFVHQARVALRRMRSAIRLWRGQVDFPADLLEELKWLAAALGGARDADVLATETLPQLAESVAGTHAAALARLTRRAAARRGQARDAARAAIASGRAARLALALLHWGTAPAERRKPTLHALAGRQLRRAQKKLLAMAQDFAALTPVQRHQVRILGKRLRYALDLLAVAQPAAPVAAAGERLAALQDVLGQLNDGAVAADALATLGASRALRAAVAAALRAREAALVAAAQAALQQFARHAPRWR